MDVRPGARLLDRALDALGRLPTDPGASRVHQARALANLDPLETDALVLSLFASAPASPDAPRRPVSPSWVELRDRLIREQRLLERPSLP